MMRRWLFILAVLACSASRVFALDFNSDTGGGGGDASGLACTDCVALGSETSGSYAAGDAEAGNATGLACTDCVTETDLASPITQDQQFTGSFTSSGVFTLHGQWDGWIVSTAAATRLTDTTFSMSGNWTGVWKKGDPVKYVDGGSTEYASITAAAFTSNVTTFTITGGTDYAMGASPTAISFSKNSYPMNFPQWFNYTPTYGNGTMTWTSVTTYMAKFRITGSVVQVKVSACGTTGGSGDPFLDATLPVTPADTSGDLNRDTAYIYDGANVPGAIIVYGLISFRRADGANWSLGAGRCGWGDVNYDY